MDKFKALLTAKPIIALVIAAVAAIVMYYTPDEVDRVIISILKTLGIAPL